MVPYARLDHFSQVLGIPKNRNLVALHLRPCCGSGSNLSNHCVGVCCVPHTRKLRTWKTTTNGNGSMLTTSWLQSHTVGSWCLEWISSHQCTSWGWARWTRFADDHLPARIGFFFPDPPCPKILYQIFFLPPPSYLPSTSPLLPTFYLPPPTNPTPPHSIARARVVERKLKLWSWSCGAVVVELLLWSCVWAMELLLWSESSSGWSQSKSLSAHETHTPTTK